MVKFQSTPHCESEANARSGRRAVGRAGFNPRLTARARRTDDLMEFRGAIDVSIHASLRERGEPQAQRRIPAPHPFQSTPHCESEANTPRKCRCSRMRSFNPRLTARARRTLYLCDEARLTSFQSTPHCESEANELAPILRRLFIGFNPRLTARARRTLLWKEISTQRDVSIHASLRERGELSYARWRLASIAFQSTPHCESEANTRW